MNDIEVLEKFIKEESMDLEVNTAIENLLKERQSDKEIINEQLIEIISYQEKLLNDYIPKSLIKEKIEELKKERDEVYIQFLESNKTDDKLHIKGIMLEGKIEVLEELLNGNM